jgi:hypothetical protein
MNLQKFKARCMDACREIAMAMQHVEQAAESPKGCPREMIDTDLISAAEALENASDITLLLAGKLRDRTKSKKAPIL